MLCFFVVVGEGLGSDAKFINEHPDFLPLGLLDIGYGYGSEIEDPKKNLLVSFKINSIHFGPKCILVYNFYK